MSQGGTGGWWEYSFVSGEPTDGEPVDTDLDTYTVSNSAVLRALYELWEVARAAMWDAYGAYGSLRWYADDGLESLTGRDLATFLWDELPNQWTHSPGGGHGQVAKALGALLTRLGKRRLAAMCTGPATRKILSVYARAGRAAGQRAARRVLACWEPPDLPGVQSWNPAPDMGAVERHAHQLVADALKHAVQSRALVPGSRRARQGARQITAQVLATGPRPGAGSWLERVQAERIATWAGSGGRLRRRLVAALPVAVSVPQPPPAHARRHLAPMRWLLDHAAAGVPLTSSGTLPGRVVADARARFGWSTRTGNPRGEHLTELRCLRELADQMRVVRRRGGWLDLTRYGHGLHQGEDDRLWEATAAQLPGRSAAAHAALLLLLACDRPLTVLGLDDQVARVLTDDGWAWSAAEGRGLRRERPGRVDLAPVGRDQGGPAVAVLRERLRLFGLVNQPRISEPVRLGEAGRVAAHAALRAAASAPRQF